METQRVSSPSPPLESLELLAVVHNGHHVLRQDVGHGDLGAVGLGLVPGQGLVSGEEEGELVGVLLKLRSRYAGVPAGATVAEGGNQRLQTKADHVLASHLKGPEVSGSLYACSRQDCEQLRQGFTCTLEPRGSPHTEIGPRAKGDSRVLANMGEVALANIKMEARLALGDTGRKEGKGEK